MTKILSIVFSLILLSGCSSKEKDNEILLLPFNAFGPAAMSEPLLGQGWWQWQTHGDSRPSEYDIKVIVYKDVPLEKVKKRYPVSEAKKNDYRYLTYTKAVNYLDKHIKENIIPKTTERLKKTKTLVTSTF